MPKLLPVRVRGERLADESSQLVVPERCGPSAAGGANRADIERRSVLRRRRMNARIARGSASRAGLSVDGRWWVWFRRCRRVSTRAWTPVKLRHARRAGWWLRFLLRCSARAVSTWPSCGRFLEYRIELGIGHDDSAAFAWPPDLFAEHDPERDLDVCTIGGQRPEQAELIELGQGGGALEDLDCGKRVRREHVEVGGDTFTRTQMGCGHGGAV